MISSKYFTFHRKCDIPNALDNLRIDDTAKLMGEMQTSHLRPIIDASEKSTGKMGRLGDADLRKLKKLGSCTHSELLVLLLEPTKESSSTIVWVDSFLRSASRGKFDAQNTAILNCRALVPNASYNEKYSDLDK